MRRSDSWALLFLVILTLLFFRDLWVGDGVLVTTNMSRWMPWRAGAAMEDLARPGFRDDSAYALPEDPADLDLRDVTDAIVVRVLITWTSSVGGTRRHEVVLARRK